MMAFTILAVASDIESWLNMSGVPLKKKTNNYIMIKTLLQEKQT